MKFLNFPPKISPRMSVEGEEWSLPEPSPPPSYLPYLTLIPADRGHVQSHLSTQPEIPAIPYFTGLLQMRFLSNVTISSEKIYLFAKRSVTREILDSKTCRQSFKPDIIELFCI